MNYLVKILIPLGLGAIAAFLNVYLVTAQTEPVVFLTVDKQINANELFDLTHAKELKMPRQFADNLSTIVPFSERGIVSGRKARRTINEGDPVFYADFDLEGEWLSLKSGEELFPIELKGVSVDSSLLRIDNNIHLRVPSESEEEPIWIGPYRIVAVGGKINNNFDDDKRNVSGGFTLSIAYKKEKDRVGEEEMMKFKQLESFCDNQLDGASILAVRIQDTRKK